MRRNTIVAMLTGVIMLGGALGSSPAYAQGRHGRVIVSGGFGYAQHLRRAGQHLQAAAQHGPAAAR
jgi:hypothetical protein